MVSQSRFYVFLCGLRGLCVRQKTFVCTGSDGVRPSSGEATRHCQCVGETGSDCLLNIAVAEDGHTPKAGFSNRLSPIRRHGEIMLRALIVGGLDDEAVGDAGFERVR